MAPPRSLPRSARRVATRVAAPLLLGASLASAPALAAPTEQEQAIAKGLFDKGVKQMDQGKCDEIPIKDPVVCKEARENFKRAYELTGALGALRNLAYTEKGLGLVASAARHFRDVAREAPKDPRPERQAWAEFAKKEAAELEPRVPHLVVKVVEKLPGLKITLDGEPLKDAAWNTAIDVDPGKHSVHAEAPGRLNFEGSVTIAEKQEKSIAVVLEVDSAPVAGDKKAPSKVGPIVTTVAGAVGVGVGLTFGYLAIKKKGDDCPNGVCASQASIDDGRTLANVSTIVTGVGAAVLVGGIVWWALTPSGAPTKDKAAWVLPYAARDGAGVAAFVRF
jgi:hypothetical protein